MTSDALKLISDGMEAASLNYAFMEWKDKISYPYFVGEYQEHPVVSEDGLQETDFILNGFTRGSWSEMEAAKEKIENYFNRTSGKTVIANSKNAVAVFYNNSLVIPTGDSELKRIEIHLAVKEWKVT